MRNIFSLGLLGALLLSPLCGCSRPASAESSLTHLEQSFPAATANPELQLAIAASTARDFATGVVALGNVKKTPGLTPQQLMAVEQAQQAMTADLIRRADGGDAAARAELARIEQSRSQ